MAAGATYEPIATTTLGSAAADITFSSIASTWTDLRISFTSSLLVDDHISGNFPFIFTNGLEIL